MTYHGTYAIASGDRQLAPECKGIWGSRRHSSEARPQKKVNHHIEILGADFYNNASPFHYYSIDMAEVTA